MNRAQLLVETTRGSLVENRHWGHVAVVNEAGKLLYSAGNPHHMTYWRSSAKPVQALPVLESGAAVAYGFSDQELALFCASHNGEKIHTDLVVKILAKIGLDSSFLQCGMHLPYHEASAHALIKAGQSPVSLHSNCSGKHSGMLATASHLGFDLSTYTELTNPLQQLILDYIAELTGYERDKIIIGIDGCGVPVHGMPLYNMALAYARLVQPQGQKSARAEACQRITRAMHTYPEMVGGSDRFCTDLMRATGGKLIGKAGAAGVYSIGIFADGVGLTIKCEDGLGRARDVAVMEVLSQLGYLSEAELAALEKYHHPVNRNHRQEKCGELRPAFTLKKEESI